MTFDFGDVPGYIRARHAAKPTVPDIGNLDDAVLPKIQIMQGEIIGPEPMQRDAVLDNSAKLDSLTQKALDFYDDLLEGGPALDAKILSAQADAARTVLTTQLRVDDSRLRKRNVDTLAKLLARIAEEEPKLLPTS